MAGMSIFDSVIFDRLPRLLPANARQAGRLALTGGLSLRGASRRSNLGGGIATHPARQGSAGGSARNDRKSRPCVTNHMNQELCLTGMGCGEYYITGYFEYKNDRG